MRQICDEDPRRPAGAAHGLHRREQHDGFVLVKSFHRITGTVVGAASALLLA
jgi:hypothetical protein